MSVFDMGKTVDKPIKGMMVIPDESIDGDEYTWQYITGWSMIDNHFYGDPHAFMGSVKDTLSKINHVSFAHQDALDLAVLLERTALELRERIGEV